MCIRDRHEPQRHHRREVERADHADHAEWLQDRVGVHVRGDVLGEAALEQVPDAAREVGDLQAAVDLAEGVRIGLAVLGHDDLGEDVYKRQVCALWKRIGGLDEGPRSSVTKLAMNRPAAPHPAHSQRPTLAIWAEAQETAWASAHIVMLTEL